MVRLPLIFASIGPEYYDRSRWTVIHEDSMGFTGRCEFLKVIHNRHASDLLLRMDFFAGAECCCSGRAWAFQKASTAPSTSHSLSTFGLKM